MVGCGWQWFIVTVSTIISILLLRPLLVVSGPRPQQRRQHVSLLPSDLPSPGPSIGGEIRLRPAVGELSVNGLAVNANSIEELSVLLRHQRRGCSSRGRQRTFLVPCRHSR